MIGEILSDTLAQHSSVVFKVPQTTKLVIYGIPRAGKTTLRKRLLGQIIGPDFEASTPIAEVCSNVLVEDVVIDECKWTSQTLEELARTLLRGIRGMMVSKESVKSNNEPPATSAAQLPISSSTSLDSPVTQHAANVIDVNTCTSTVKNDKETAESNTLGSTPVIKLETTDRGAFGSVNVHDILLKAINSGDWCAMSEVLKPLSQLILVQVIDTGGQPSFQEILPAFMNGHFLSLFLFKLTDDLETPINVKYMNHDGKEFEWREKYVLKEFLFQTLASILSNAMTSQHISSLTNTVLLIGTHKDIVVDQTIVDKLKDRLLGLIRETASYRAIDVTPDVFIDVDCLNDADVLSVRKRIYKMLIQQTKHEVSASWLVFDVVLRTYAKDKKLRKTDIAQCKEIGHALGIQDISEVLQYLHSKLGTILYFPKIQNFSDIVIIDFQLILDSISHVVIHRFNDTRGAAHKMDKEMFNDEGCFDASNLEDIDGLLSASNLLALMRYRHIIAKVSSSSSSCSSNSLYFMPSVLPLCQADPTGDLSSGSSSLSLLVLFDSGHCPVGLFCGTAAFLINSRGWELQRSEQFRNKIHFDAPALGKHQMVTISACSTHFEVCLHLGSSAADSAVFREIYSTVDETLKTVSQALNCGAFEYGFYCPLECKYKKVVYLKGVHPAKLIKTELRCIYSHKYSKIEENHKLWIYQV